MKVILQLAESGSFLRQVDLFKVRGKFALSDAYEDHFMLPKGKIFIVTHRRAVLLEVSEQCTKKRTILVYPNRIFLLQVLLSDTCVTSTQDSEIDAAYF